jgi:hypothetical protein
VTANDEPTETTGASPGAQPSETMAATPDAQPSETKPAPTPTAWAGTDRPAAEPAADLGDRMGAFGREAAAAGERLGRDAQAAGERLGVEAQAAAERLRRDPAVAGAADWASRAWGLLVLAIGLWFLADVTLGFDMPSLAWRELWPLLLIVVGLAVVFRGLARRR